MTNHVMGSIAEVNRGALVSEIRETYRQRQDMVRAMTALSNQQFSVFCRLNPDDPKCKAKARQREKWLAELCATNLGDPRCQEIGHEKCVTHWDAADPDASRNSDAGQSTAATRHQHAGVTPSEDERDEEGQSRVDTRSRTVDLAALVSLPYQLAEEPLRVHRARLEKRLELLVRDLPVYPWVESVRGFGALGLAQIVGETGDLSNYDTPAKVWKRMGLAVINGGRQRRVTGDEAFEHGYNPARRSVMWVIGDSLLKGNRDGAYRTYYLSEKERQRELHPDLSDLVTHLRAKRHMEKRLLRNLWIEWRAASAMQPGGLVLAAESRDYGIA